MPLSTATPEKFPNIEGLRRLTKSIAMLDAIICPEWDYRYYSFNSKWGPGEEMASMRNGCGDEWFLLFDCNGAALKGLAHEYPLAGDASFALHIQEVVPSVFASFLHEPAFDMKAASFCIWRRHTDSVWRVVSTGDRPVNPEDDGSTELILIFDGDPETYRAWAEAYYEREIPKAGVEALYKHEPLNEQLVNELNAAVSLADIMADVAEIGYPCHPSG